MVLKSPPLTSPSDTKWDVGGGVRQESLGKHTSSPKGPLPAPRVGLKATNSLLGSAISPWSGVGGNSEQFPFTTRAAQHLEELI